MARRKRSRGRRAFASVRRAARRTVKGNPKVRLFQPDAFVYGAVRAPISNLTKRFTGNLLGQFGGIADELVMGFINFTIAKNTSGMIKRVAMKGIDIENARLGDALLSGGIGVLAKQEGTIGTAARTVVG